MDTDASVYVVEIQVITNMDKDVDKEAWGPCLRESK